MGGFYYIWLAKIKHSSQAGAVAREGAHKEFI